MFLIKVSGQGGMYHTVRPQHHSTGDTPAHQQMFMNNNAKPNVCLTYKSFTVHNLIIDDSKFKLPDMLSYFKVIDLWVICNFHINACSMILVVTW